MPSSESGRPALPDIEALKERFPNKTGPERVPLALDPQVIGELYYRCPKCLYRYVHGQDSAQVYPKTFVEVGQATIDQIAVNGTFDIGKERVELLGQRIAVVSTPLLIGNPVFDVHLEGEVPAIIRTRTGKTYVAWYEKYVAEERRQSTRDFVYQGFAYALAHPADPSVAPVEVDGSVIVIFKDVRLTDAHGRIAIALRPDALIERERQDDHARSTARIIARILSAQTAPPSAFSCRFCR